MPSHASVRILGPQLVDRGRRSSRLPARTGARDIQIAVTADAAACPDPAGITR
jgi:hypothetical protein